MSFTIHNVEQRSDEWFALRKGRITASEGKRLVTPTGRVSTTWKDHLCVAFAEGHYGQLPPPPVDTYWMERGRELEDDARTWFEVDEGVPVDEVGFITHNEWQAGASPDGLIDGRIPVEIKCPKPSTHLKWLNEYRQTGSIPKDHLPQVHFQMAVLGSEIGYFMSYYPDAPAIIQMIQRNKMTELMEEQLAAYTAEYKSLGKYLGIKEFL